MRRTILTLTLPALLMTGATQAAAGGLEVRIGGWFPQSQSCSLDETSGRACFFRDLEDIFINEEQVGVRPKDFNGLFGGVEYNTAISDNLELGVHFDVASGDVDTSYRDYERESTGEDIFQTLRLRTAPLGATLRLVPTSRRARFAPYVGAGVDAVFYRYEEEGALIDFYTGDIFENDLLTDSGVAFGVHGVAGARFAINEDFAVVAEGRYLFARKDMEDDFAPNESGLVNRIDLSGFGVSVGLRIRF